MEPNVSYRLPIQTNTLMFTYSTIELQLTTCQHNPPTKDAQLLYKINNYYIWQIPMVPERIIDFSYDLLKPEYIVSTISKHKVVYILNRKLNKNHNTLIEDVCRQWSCSS